MAVFARKHTIDWCYLCGGRSSANVEIWKPDNAEHEQLNRPCLGPEYYLRICAACGEEIRRVGSGEVDRLVVDRPGWYKKKDFFAKKELSPEITHNN